MNLKSNIKDIPIDQMNQKKESKKARDDQNDLFVKRVAKVIGLEITEDNSSSSSGATNP